ncbi:aminoglycoside phosphotransferase family protein [Pseudomaricurvus sp. HS19]|uniref:aminoglycoside phosphotransferase family protein n=1 Tax=Pseudomaricurvus sp. HS19 TaxID=2692626 RepID=UPI001369F6A3|nr:phosphotransferase [Pseudomaricurvus sp. HS19]MYM64340.1 phosphotransferase [Pseudomaricurvus sp. HS19]
MNTEQINALQQWAEQRLEQLGIGTDGALVLTPLNGDAGFRRYFRLNTQQPLLAVLAPPETEDSAAFVAIARYLRSQGVMTPKIPAVDLQHGWLLVEELGQRLFSEVLLEERDLVEQMYGDALMTLLRLQQCPTITMPAADGDGMHTLPRYDSARLNSEMALFHEWFVPQLLGYQLSADERELLDAVYLQLESAALQQPQVWVHRDYHSRNLIYRDGQAPGVIDFQDAVRGPITYDLVSLLRDCYIRWPRQQVEKWALAYGDMAVSAGLMAPVTQRGFLRWFDLMGLQRHLKVLGIFARLWLRDGKAGYLRDLPLVMRYTLEVAEGYPELRDFTYWFKEKLLPLCEQQEWYSDYTCAGESQV